MHVGSSGIRVIKAFYVDFDANPYSESIFEWFFFLFKFCPNKKLIWCYNASKKKLLNC